MAGEAQRIHPQGDGGPDHLLGGIFPVAENGVGVEILDHVIFSCFTLWSTTWRFSSSRVTSSTVMPSCTISTITW